jgi:outer membrane protein assembly factor BamB
MSDYRNAPSAPLVVAGTQVTALDQETGAVRWTYSEITRRALRIHVTQERVFVLDYEGNLHCLRLADGIVHGVVPLDGDEATMLPVGDRLYVFAGKKVYAIDSNGRVLWQCSVGFDGGWGLVGLGVPENAIQPDFSRS